jgi:hypothetical protein
MKDPQVMLCAVVRLNDGHALEIAERILRFAK